MIISIVQFNLKIIVRILSKINLIAFLYTIYMPIDMHYIVCNIFNMIISEIRKYL